MKRHQSDAARSAQSSHGNFNTRGHKDNHFYEEARAGSIYDRQPCDRTSSNRESKLHPASAGGAASGGGGAGRSSSSSSSPSSSSPVSSSGSSTVSDSSPAASTTTDSSQVRRDIMCTVNAILRQRTDTDSATSSGTSHAQKAKAAAKTSTMRHFLKSPIGALDDNVSKIDGRLQQLELDKEKLRRRLASRENNRHKL